MKIMKIDPMWTIRVSNPAHHTKVEPLSNYRDPIPSESDLAVDDKFQDLQC
jgi:hypothetical protein